MRTPTTSLASSDTFLDRRQFVRSAAAAAALLSTTRLWASADSGGAQVIALDLGWRFFRGEVASGEAVIFDDEAWRSVDLPHDWSIETKPENAAQSTSWTAPVALWNETARGATPVGQLLLFPEVPDKPDGPPLQVGPFDAKESPGQFATGWTLGGIGWYRKTFTLPAMAEDSHVEVRFDGVCRHSKIWLNGQEATEHFNGYTGFAVDLTRLLNRSGPNVLAVRVANEGNASRWYSGSGIYRHVSLKLSRHVRIPNWGVNISTPVASANQSQVRVRTSIQNQSAKGQAVEVNVRIIDKRGDTVVTAHQSAHALSGSILDLDSDLAIHGAELWSPDSPTLYRAEITVLAQGRVVDRCVTPFGIRRIEIDAKRGLRLNGVSTKLKGACVHHDNGLLGAKAIDRAEVRKVELLKENGFNAIRCSHNPFSPAFLDACDSIGMLVIDEVFDVWETHKVPDDYASLFKDHWQEDLTAMVRRDRNHPSVVFWSIGNEIPERNTPRGVEIARELRDEVRRLDPTRHVTAALAPLVSGKAAEPSRRYLDVVGYNYMSAVYENDHAENTETVFMGTEQWASDIYSAWKKVEANSWLIGDFVWTGVDYIGEAGAGSSQLRPSDEKAPPSPLPLSIFLWDYPAFQSGCGEIDLLGLKKPQSFFRDVLWKRESLALFVQRPVPAGMKVELGNWGWHDELQSWTWPNSAGQLLKVRTYTNSQEVALRLNGREIARKALAKDAKLTIEFDVPYEPGQLVAVAYVNGKEVSRRELVTTGAPARLRLRAEKARVGRTRDDLAYVFAEVLDGADRVVADGDVPLVFSVSGVAELIAAGSANPRAVESVQDPLCRTFHGVAQAILRPLGSSGVARLHVESPGLSAASIDIEIGEAAMA